MYTKFIFHQILCPLPPCGKLQSEVLGADALRMRLRRLCETKASGRQWVDQQTKDDYKSGGERRQWLELALLESRKKHGTNRTNYQKVKVRCCCFFEADFTRGLILCIYICIKTSDIIYTYMSDLVIYR